MLNLKKRGLGKGLGELGISELLSRDINEAPVAINAASQQLPIEMIQPGKYQPRKNFAAESLQELANSIQAQGIIQPLIVRAINNNQYELIAGERRWRAAQLAGLQQIPVIIRAVSDEAAMAMALIENIQREDLNPLEEATALQRLIAEFGMTQEEAATAVGKARSTVTNLLRLLQLNFDVKILLEQGLLELGHAKILLSLTGSAQSEIAKTIVSKKLSVRDTEILVQGRNNSAAKVSKTKNIDPNIAKLQTELSDKLGAAVTIQHHHNGKGQLVIYYNSLDEFLQHVPYDF